MKGLGVRVQGLGVEGLGFRVQRLYADLMDMWGVGCSNSRVSLLGFL